MSYGLEVRMTHFEVEFKADEDSIIAVFVCVQKDGREIERYSHERTFDMHDKDNMALEIGKCMQFCLDQIT